MERTFWEKAEGLGEFIYFEVGIPEGTGQSSDGCAVEGISAQGQGKETPFHPMTPVSSS